MLRWKHSLLAGALLLVYRSQAAGQISPGPLSQAHAHLEGVAQCANCHDFGGHARRFKCLECHAEIQHRLEAHAGYHARAYRSSAGETDCIRCHMEHNGQTFPLIRLDRKGFDHAAQTGFALEGKHRTLACEQCHTSKNIPAAARSQIKLKDLKRSFLGLQRACTACHEDAHRGQEGTECSRCHQQESWRQAPGFAHSSTSFPLTGLHQAVACEKCHVPRVEEKAGGEKVALFKGLSHNGCQSCHMDPHRGAFREVKFAGSCENCHQTAGWKNNHPSAGFDHNSTKFALVGKHAELACGRCHKDGDFRRPIAHDRCGACHEDPHKGQFAARAAGSDCSACHGQNSYKPALFDREAHRHAAFALEGKHAQLPCSDCHQPAGRDAVYITRKLACLACHSDQHQGQFAAAPLENKCDLCHAQSGFQPSTFSRERHAETKFALSGKHASIECGNCHKPLTAEAEAAPVGAVTVGATRPASGAPPRRYHFASLSCQACHTDPHRTTLSCETCHTTETWKSVRLFDHSTTKFPVTGAHQLTACTRCHSGSPPQFSGQSAQCSACHEVKDVHGGQFRSGGREEDCSICHVTTQWSTKIFDHDQAQFALDVAHRNVSCGKCHKEQKDALGKMVRVYRGTPLECVKCH